MRRGRDIERGQRLQARSALSAASISVGVTRQRLGGERDAVELGGQRQQGRIAAGAHIGDDAAHGGRDIGLTLALGRQQRRRRLRRNPALACRSRRAISSSILVAGAAERGPFAAEIAEPGIDAFDLELERAAAGEHQFDLAARDPRRPWA